MEDLRRQEEFASTSEFSSTKAMAGSRSEAWPGFMIAGAFGASAFRLISAPAS